MAELERILACYSLKLRKNHQIFCSFLMHLVHVRCFICDLSKRSTITLRNSPVCSFLRRVLQLTADLETNLFNQKKFIAAMMNTFCQLKIDEKIFIKCCC